LGLGPNIDLSKGFYQYANRLAHLYFLRVLNDIPAYLVFVYFINDYTHIPTSKAEWLGALQLMHSYLGSRRHKLSKYVIVVFIDVKKRNVSHKELNLPQQRIEVNYNHFHIGR